MQQKYYIVWNSDRSEGFVTPFPELAYEVRKSAYHNCYDREGNPHPVAEAFCNEHFEGYCTIEEIDL